MSQSILLAAVGVSEDKHGQKTIEARRIHGEGGVTVVLVRQWSALAVRPGDPFSIVAIDESGLDSDATSFCIGERPHLVINLFPDDLVSATAAANTSPCVRRPLMQHLYPSMSSNRLTMRGTLIHELFQLSMKEKDFSFFPMKQRIDLICTERARDIYGANWTMEEAASDLAESIPMIQQWAYNYLGKKPFPVTSRKPSKVSVLDVTDIEENVFYPHLGLKGKFDATMKIEIDTQGKKRVATIPFELKTGKNHTFQHKAQAFLYAHMNSSRNEYVSPLALLHYVTDAQMEHIESEPHLLSSILFSRSQLAGYLQRPNDDLAPLARSESTCGRCYQKETCLLHHFAHESGTEASSGVPTLFGQTTSHLNELDRTYLRYWDNLLYEEFKFCSKNKTLDSFWSQSNEEGFLGPSLTGLEIINERQNGYASFSYTFKTTGVASIPFSEDEMVYITKKPTPVASRSMIATKIAFIRHISPHEVTLSISDRLYAHDIDRTLKTWTLYRAVRAPLRHRTAESLMSLFLPDTPEYVTNLRYILVHNKTPVMGTAPISIQAWPEALFKGYQQLNEDQQKAVLHVLQSHDFSIVMGYPGCGKTNVIIFLLRVLVHLGQSVLITSHTNAAVDNILRRFEPHSSGVCVLRTGSRSTTSTLTCSRFYEPNSSNFTSTEEYGKYIDSVQIAATTCLGLSHPIYSKRVFDWCIVDEASQILEPVAVGPLLRCRKFVLVGDQNQLPPLVRCQEIADQLGVSLLSRLATAHPTSSCCLRIQYRMNEDILSLSNALFYNGCLRGASKEVLTQTFELPRARGLHIEHQWLRDLVDRNEQSVWFLETSQLVGVQETRVNKSLQNEVEAQIVGRIVKTYINAGVPADSIGVISPYRSQLALIRRSVHKYGVEADTVDKYQGRDKDCIIVSFVRSNQGEGLGGILKDWRRVNVAVSRAKKKLICVGRRETLEQDSTLKRMLSIMSKRQWLYTMLPEGELYTQEGQVTK